MLIWPYYLFYDFRKALIHRTLVEGKWEVPMKMYLISDNIDTLTGMRLAGVDGIVVHEKEELQKALSDVLLNKEIGIVLLTEKFGKNYPELINHLKLEYKFPLFVEIPDRHGTGRNPDFITAYVNEAIGLKL